MLFLTRTLLTHHAELAINMVTVVIKAINLFHLKNYIFVCNSNMLKMPRKTSQTIKLTEAVANFVDARAFYVTCNQLFP